MNNVYESPLSSRYASKEMLYTFSSDMKFLHLASAVAVAG